MDEFLTTNDAKDTKQKIQRSLGVGSFLESVSEISAKLKEVFADGHIRKFDDVVNDAEKAAVLVVVY